MRPLLLAAALLLGGCTLTPGCFVGMSLFPPSPVVICGFDGEHDAPNPPANSKKPDA